MFSYHENIHKEKFSRSSFARALGEKKSLSEKKKSFENEKTLFSHLTMYITKEDFRDVLPHEQKIASLKCYFGVEKDVFIL
jgi:hypothetical protein